LLSGADLRRGAPGKKKINIFAEKFCIIVNLRSGETEEGEERLESEFFSIKREQKKLTVLSIFALCRTERRNM
jgi:hypothetical protein